MLRNIILAGLISTAATSASATTVLDFDGLISGVLKRRMVNWATPNEFTVDGFKFQSMRTVFAYGPAHKNTAIPSSGSTSLNVSGEALVAQDAQTAKLTLSKENGTPFNVRNLRVAEGRTFVMDKFGNDYSDYGSTSLNIEGTFAHGGSISYLHKFDGVADHGGPLDDFELLALKGFENLSSLVLTGIGGPQNGYSFSVDDITLADPAPVPLPAGALFLATALAMLGMRRNRP